MSADPTHDLVIYGASDDLVELEGAFREEYDGEHVRLLVSSGGEQTEVRCDYDGEWAIAIAPVAEDVPMHPGRIGQRKHSAEITLHTGPRPIVHVLPAAPR